jgi:two-component system, NarL family, response regulator NreC
MTTVVLAEDHSLVREGLKSLLQRDPALKVIGEAGDGLQAIGLVETLKPDILLLDLMIPRMHGLEVLREVQKLHATKIVVVSMHANEPYVSEAFRNGAAAYVLKDATSAELLQAIRAVLSGNRYLSPALAEIAVDLRLKKLATNKPDVYSTLSARERSVLQMSAEGHSSARIGKMLYISRRTVESHRANLMKKLSLRSQTDLVRFAVRKKIIDP